MFFFNLRLNNREAGDLRRHRAHCYATVMHYTPASGIGLALALAIHIFVVLIFYSLFFEAETKWPPFRRRQFQTHFLE